MKFRLVALAAACLSLSVLGTATYGAQWGSGGTPAAVEGEFLVPIGAGFNLNAKAKEIAAAYGAEVSLVSPRLRVAKVKFPAGTDKKAIQTKVANTEIFGVGKLEPNYIRTLHKGSLDGPEPDPADYYIFSVTDAYEAWDVRTDAREIIVAVIDTGVGYTHPDLAENIWINRGEVPNNGIDDDKNGFIDDNIGWDVINNDNDPFPGAPDNSNSHGTHVAGTIGAQGDNGIGFSGVCWRARIMPIRVFDDTSSTTSAAIVAGIEYAVRNGARVINMSLGGYGDNAAEESAIAYARSKGVLCVCSAGNGGIDGLGDDNDRLKSYPASYQFDNIIAVSATGASDTLTSFSNYGFANVDIAAPGEQVFSTVIADDGTPDYDLYDGTSMAAPMTSGATTLVWAEYRKEGYRRIRKRILDAADRLPALTGTNVTGGRLNIRKAIAKQTVPPTIDFRTNGYYATIYTGYAYQNAQIAYYYGGLDTNVYIGYQYAYYGYLTASKLGYRVAYDTDTYDQIYKAYKAVRAQHYQMMATSATYLYGADTYIDNPYLSNAALYSYYAYLNAQYDLSY
jgi:subtilisin family serine protease